MVTHYDETCQRLDGLVRDAVDVFTADSIRDGAFWPMQMVYATTTNAMLALLRPQARRFLPSDDHLLAADLLEALREALWDDP